MEAAFEAIKVLGFPAGLVLVLIYCCRELVSSQAKECKEEKDALLAELKLSRAAHIQTLESYGLRFEETVTSNNMALERNANSTDQMVIQIGRLTNAINTLPCQPTPQRQPISNNLPMLPSTSH